MGFARTYSVALVGIQGHIVEVEADITAALPGFVLLGLPDASLSEAKDRVKSAAKNAGIPLPQRKITINLTPPTLAKRGSGFDLALVMAALQAAGELKIPEKIIYLGELGLDGSLRRIPGILPAVQAAVDTGFEYFVVPKENLEEAILVPGAQVRGFSSLAELLVASGIDEKNIKYPPVRKEFAGSSEEQKSKRFLDMAEVSGQSEGRFALEIAAAGAHHLLFKGPPGSGKTMLAERLPGILPPLDDSSAMDVTAIHSLCGTGTPRHELIREPPFEAPHHSASAPAILGGGSGIPKPGAISKAHRGVLFLDEAPEFKRTVLDSLRQPLESGQITLDRSIASAVYPARFQLVLAANPCPCGMNTGRGLECTCSSKERRNYFGRLSGPLLDRVDLHITVPRVQSHELALTEHNESSESIRTRVIQARAAQRERLAPYGLSTNAETNGRLLRGDLKLDAALLSPLLRAIDRGTITARGFDRVLRTAWTIADLEGKSSPAAEHLDLAMYFRNLHSTSPS